MPFRLFLSRKSPGPITKDYPKEFASDLTTSFTADKIRMRLLTILFSMTRKFDKYLTKSKNRYKRHFYKAVKYIPMVSPVSEVYL